MAIYKTTKQIIKAHKSGILTPEDYVKSTEQMTSEEKSVLKKKFKRGEGYTMAWLYR